MHVYTVGEGLSRGEIINTYILHARVTKEVGHSWGDDVISKI